MNACWQNSANLVHWYPDTKSTRIRQSCKGETLLNVTKAHIEQYLYEIHEAVRNGNYQIASRYKNMDMYIEYVFTEKDAEKLLLSLRTEDFSKVVKNAHPGYQEEALYIFGKEVTLLPRFGGGEENVPFYLKLNKLAGSYVIVISLHRQKIPLSYPFRDDSVERSSKAHARGRFAKNF